MQTKQQKQKQLRQLAQENCNKDCRNYNKGILQKDLNNNCKKTGNCNDNNDQLSEKR